MSSAFKVYFLIAGICFLKIIYMCVCVCAYIYMRMWMHSTWIIGCCTLEGGFHSFLWNNSCFLKGITIPDSRARRARARDQIPELLFPAVCMLFNNKRLKICILSTWLMTMWLQTIVGCPHLTLTDWVNKHSLHPFTITIPHTS